MEVLEVIRSAADTASARIRSAADNAWARAAVATTLALGSAGAFAQAGPDPFTTAMTEATTKVNLYAAALVGLGAVSVIFMIALKYVKRIPRAS